MASIPAAGRAAIDAVLVDHPQVQLDDRAGYQADQEAQFDSVLIAVNGLLGLALLIALLGIANTLALSVLERTREIGLLRAVGMRRRQTRQMVLAESVMVAVFGAVMGVVLGIVFGVALASGDAFVGDHHHRDPRRHHRGDRADRRVVRRRRRAPPGPPRGTSRRAASHRQRMTPRHRQET